MNHSRFHDQACSRNACLILCFLAACLMGCDRETPRDGAVKLVIAITPGAAERYVYRAALDRFHQKHPEIEVQSIEIPGNYYQKILVMIAGRNSPDLMWMGQGVGEFADRGTLLDITERIAGDASIADISPAAMNTYRFRGRQYGVPFGVDTQFIVFNRKLFELAKVPLPTREWDFAQFLDAARRLTIDKDGDGTADQFGFCGELDASLFSACFISPDGAAGACSNEAMLRYLHTNLDLYHKHKVALRGKEAGEGTLDDNLTLFRQGKVAMMLMMTWDLPFVRSRLADMDWDVISNPRVDRQAQWGSTQAVVIGSQTRHPDEAWTLCREFFGDEFQTQMAPFVVPSNRRIAAQVLGMQRQPANHEALLWATQHMTVDPRVPHLSELIKYWYDARESVWCGEATPEQAMSRADSQINRALREFSGIE